MNKSNLILKRNKDLLDSNIKLEITIIMPKFDLAKINLYIQCMISGRSTHDETLRHK